MCRRSPQVAYRQPNLITIVNRVGWHNGFPLRCDGRTPRAAYGRIVATAVFPVPRHNPSDEARTDRAQRVGIHGIFVIVPFDPFSGLKDAVVLLDTAHPPRTRQQPRNHAIPRVRLPHAINEVFVHFRCEFSFPEEAIYVVRGRCVRDDL